MHPTKSANIRRFRIFAAEFCPVCRAEHRSFWWELPVGVRHGCRTLAKGQEAPFANPRQKLRSAGNKRHPGGVSFGDFSLAKHKFVWNEFEQPIGWPEGRKPRMVFVAKVTRLSGRDPTPKQPVAPATQPLNDSVHYALRLNDQNPATPTPNNQNAPGKTVTRNRRASIGAAELRRMLSVKHSAHYANTNAPYKNFANIKRFQISRQGFLPYAAPSTGAFERISPQGRRMDAARCRRGRKPLSATPFKSEERREQAASGLPFLWILSFGGAKESTSAVGPRPDSKTNRRASDTTT